MQYHSGSDSSAYFLAASLLLSHGEVTADDVASALASEPEALDLAALNRVALKLGFKARRSVVIFRQRMMAMPMPFLAEVKGGGVILVRGVDQAGIRHGAGGPDEAELLSWDDARAQLTGSVLQMVWPGRQAVYERFSWRWFLKAVVRYRKPLTGVIVFSALIQVCTFVTPMFFQVVVDKVIIHRAQTTLDVLALGLAGIYVFEAVLTWLRGYLMPHTTNRIDVELASRTFDHLLGLPQKYFDARRVGDSVARLHEIENIRNFITSSALTLLVDSVFAVILIFALFFYSSLLAWIVVATLPIYIVISLVMVPIYRSMLERKFDIGAHRQAFAVEMVTGMGTVKALSVESFVQRIWDRLTAAYVAISFKVTTLGNAVDQFARFVSRICLLLVLYFGATEVMEGRLTVGQLVAFNMLAQQLTEPILKLVHVWSQFQQARVSIARVGDILNNRQEAETGEKLVSAPPVMGAIAFRDATFRYGPDLPDAIANVSLEIEAGEVIGIVGTSGSGKSTLTRLVQGLHHPTGGRVLVDDLDVKMLEPRSIRRQIGVVLQENVLFNATVAENIAFGRPDTSMEEIVGSARLAGAHEFIVELPHGYNTMIGERSASLSGGQRQRVAIARALVSNPPILIFDEATSALDYETEARIQANMSEITMGRTVIIIAHRLSTVRSASRIVVMERGRIVEVGSHDELIARGGRYATLHAIQAS